MISHIHTDGAQLAVASSIGIWLYDAHTGAEIALYPVRHEGVRSVAFSPNGRTLACGSGLGYSSEHRIGTIWLLDAKTGELKQPLEGHTSEVNSVAFSPDGRTLASGSGDDTVHLWDVTSADTCNMS